MEYELDWTRYYPENGHHTVIAILTGLPIEEIIAACPDKLLWGGQTYVDVFRKLGFNVNPRFVKFDPDTKHPCIMRCRRTDIKEPYWYGWVYYNGRVESGNCSSTLDDFFKRYSSLRITSMLQAWI